MRIEGRVVGSDGEPVAGASVSAYCGLVDDGLLFHDVSAADGTWRLDVRAGTYELGAYSHDHYRGAAIFLECDGQTPQRDLVLHVGDALEATSAPDTGYIGGLVVEDDGRPAVGATVRIVETSERPNRSVSMANWSGETDLHGRFHAYGLWAAEYTVIAEWKGRDHNAARRPRYRIRPGDRSLRIVLATGATVTGCVLIDGKPVPEFGVSFLRSNVGFGFSTDVRAPDGRFVLKHVALGTWRVAVSGPGTRLKVIDEVTLDGGAHVDLGAIAMERGRRVTGHVHDRTGTPVAGALVIVGHYHDPTSLITKSQPQHHFQRRFETTTDAAGAYVFDGIDAHHPRSRTPHIWATHPSAGVSLIRELPDADLKIDFTLVDAGRIEGVVDGLRAGRAVALAARADEPEGARMAHGDDRGRFRFDDVPVGDYVVTLTVAEHEHIAPARVTVVANETATTTLTTSSTSVQLYVTVPGGRGRDFKIEPVSEGVGIGHRFCRIGRDGGEDTWHLEFVRPGEYRVSLDGATWESIHVASSPAKQSIDYCEPPLEPSV